MLITCIVKQTLQFPLEMYPLVPTFSGQLLVRTIAPKFTIVNKTYRGCCQKVGTSGYISSGKNQICF